MVVCEIDCHVVTPPPPPAPTNLVCRVRKLPQHVALAASPVRGAVHPVGSELGRPQREAAEMLGGKADLPDA